MTRTLHLVLKRKWWDMIASGEKTEEYREIKPYWEKRLLNEKAIRANIANIMTAKLIFGYYDVAARYSKKFEFVTFYLGYAKDRPSMTFKFGGLTTGKGKSEWGATDELMFVVKLGERVK